MSQVSYGTITITDTNDIESIVIEYAQNQDSSNPPSSGWDTVRPTWRQNYFIWQRTRIHKSGTTADKDSFGAAVCLTGSTGATGSTGQSLSTTKTQYTHVASNVTITTSNHTSYTWTDNVPEYDSIKPVYWGRITNTYINPAKTKYIIYKDNGLTEAIAKSVEANTNASDALDKANESNSIAIHANENAQGALSISRATQQHFWFNSTTSGSIEAGAYITDTPIDTFKSGKNGGYLLARSDGVELGRGTNKFMTLSATALNFYRPGTNTIDATLTSKGLILSKGGIEAGTKNTTNYIYIYSDDDATNHKLTINSHEASDWRIVAGKNFGVDKAGNLYASGANIQGQVTITSGSNVYTKTEADAAYDKKGAASAVQTNLDNLEIGGRNLLVGTADSISKATTATSSYVTQILYDTPNQETLSALRFSANDEVTLSFDWKITSASTYGNARIEWYGTKGSSEMTYIAPLINPFATFSASNTSGHVATTVKLTSATILSKRIVLRIDNSNLTLTISNLKLEKGNKATDWTPAPEDLAATATNYITKIDERGITIHPEDPTSSNYLQINSDGISINTVKGTIAKYGESIRLGDSSTYLEITSNIVEFFDNKKSMAKFGYDEIFESYGVQGENIFIKGAGNALRLDNNVNGTYQGQYILETRANGHLSLKPGLRRTEEEV